ncbi:MAG: aminodeoxychorismate synthase component I [Bryobacteraceae bacterium]
MRLLIVDNYDSFTFNLFQLAAEVFESVPTVLPNDHDFDDIVARNFDAVIISPGPGSPVNDEDFGVCKRIICELNLPIFGVCLGHQGIGHLMGGTVMHAPVPMHGRENKIYHEGSGIFEGVPSPFVAVRYHSLMLADSMPECLHVTAWTEDGLIMGIAHKTRPIWSVQFHPESICSTFGRELMGNFHRLAADFHRTSGRWRAMQAKKAEPATHSFSSAETRAQRKLRTHVRRTPLTFSAEQIFERAFNRLPYAFWLDSSVTRERDARFSFLGGEKADDVECVRYFAHNRRLAIRRHGIEELSKEELLSYVEHRLSSAEVTDTDLPFDFDGGFVGYFGYELKDLTGAHSAHRASHPDCLAILATRFVAIDHWNNQMFLVCITDDSDSEAFAREWFQHIEAAISDESAAAQPLNERGSPETITFCTADSEADYLEKIDHALEAITDGETYEVCLTNQLTANTGVDPFSYYKQLRKRNPAPYSAFLRFPELCVASSSPERFLKIGADRVVETKPIKGTAPRGRSEQEDQKLKTALAEDAKSRSENLMIVDLLRNDLGRVCSIGSVHVPKLMHVESYATVHQLVTTVRGTLDAGKSPVDCLRAAFPGGSMTGAPKIRTMEIIDELEGRARGVYSGSIGFLSFSGKADLSIVIRTAVFSRNTVTIGVGGAVIALSDPQEEWQEILLKAKALLATFEAMGNTVVLSTRNPEVYGTTIDVSKRVG